MNNKGFVISTTVFIVMLVVAGAISLAYSPLLNSRYSLVQTKNHMKELIEERNALERMHGKIYSGDFLSGDINFEDLGIEAVYINADSGTPTETVTASSTRGDEVYLAMELTADTKIQLIIDYTASWNEGVSYPPGISRYDFELIHETEGVMPLEGIKTTDVLGAVILTIDPSIMPLGNYIVRVNPTKVDVTIEAQYQLILGSQQILELYKDGVLIHTQYIN